MLRSPDGVPRSSGDLLYDAVYSGAIGGSVIALFFLGVDLLEGRPLYTPTVLGSALFRGVTPGKVVHIDLLMVAYYSVLHFVAFGLLGAFAAFLAQEAGALWRHPSLLGIVLFLVLEGSFALSAIVFLPGVGMALGAGWVTAANALTAAAMAAFLFRAHGIEREFRAEHSAHPDSPV